MSDHDVSRRRFLVGTGAAAGLALVAGACTGDGDGDGPGAVQTPTTRRPRATGDLAVAEVGAALEKLAVDTYAATLTAAAGGRLGDVPGVVTELLTTVRAHHEVHLSSWNTMLRAGGRPDVTEPNASLKPAIDRMFAEVRDAAGAARMGLVLEDITAQTYNRAIPTLRTREAIRLAAQMQVVDQQHISVLRYVVGVFPVGSGEVQESRAFQPTDRAASG
ncbi:MAG: ferritin-like domain-containing protein [Actinomycetota bacterium]|nr:ferritin-like domain-containing protein [Actinomycetota bacterium]